MAVRPKLAVAVSQTGSERLLLGIFGLSKMLAKQQSSLNLKKRTGEMCELYLLKRYSYG